MNLDEILAQITNQNYSAFFYTPSYYKGSKSYLFKKPSEIISIKKNSEVKTHLKKIDDLIKKGMWCYALINYEAGYLFEERLKKYLNNNEEKLIQFFFFKNENVEVVRSTEILFSNELKKYKINNFKLDSTKHTFIRNISNIKKFIEEGDTYQVNYTVKGNFNFSGDVKNLFQTLLFNQSARYSAFINSDDYFILSHSPELFFRKNRNKIIAKPMKGTAKRGINLISDHQNKFTLENDNKNKAENLMIVDLLRNDLGKISKYGRVKTVKLFGVEKYESLFQMISKIKSELKNDISVTEIVKNIFPCGSITGAPKIRTMEIINELEKKPRGIYTGAIGIANKNFSVFNVAIRTVKINKTTHKGEVGLGSGILWDSNPINEFEEVLLKSNFIKKPNKYFEIFETMLIKNGKVFLLDEHLIRMSKSADYFLFSFDEAKVKREIDSQLKKIDKEKSFKYKLILNKWGKVVSDISKISIDACKKKIIISKNIINSQNPFQYFKTTNRKLYDSELKKYKRKGFFDVIFFNESNQLAEGAITNIFLKKGGDWVTPSLSCGILPGVFRENYLLENGNIKEEILSIRNLISAEEIMLTNSVRGEIKISKLYLSENEFIAFE